jgi:transcriptional regulator with XRE-family HTH domain
MRWKSPTGVDQQVAENIRRFRNERGWSQEQLGEAVGVTFQQIQKYENGKNRITIGRLVMICEVLGIDLDEVIRSGNAKNGR